ncbi:MAG: B12-binding domain-containing radical SAM protein [Spirochaetales bacterium]|uniref:B12-binding domain-containing radical SAM protein n=1 Tax=Candidatus Thalassospirochaeta sargassi TaxID=3119039 RepID=A0AAJ1IF03_9SPIO|nr:B12-binding domain-containing radical SAM protein [Spirochaetales bacterium]
MKAVVAVPSVCDFYFTPSRASAIGAEAVKRVLQDHDIDARILNFPTFAAPAAKLPVPPELGHLQSFIIPKEGGPISGFSTYRRFGPDAAECARQLLAEKPDIIFISCFAWAYAAQCIELATAIKTLSLETSVAAGGAGVTVNPDYFSSQKSIDYVLPGTAEEVLPSFLGTGRQPVDGGPALKIPDFIAVETGISTKKNVRFFSAMLTRGCPKACRFCANHLVHGRRFRKAPLDAVRKEIGLIPQDRNVSINFEDDNLTFDFDYFLEVIKVIKERFPDAQFTAENGLDYNFLDGNKVRELIRLGFRAFNLSMASHSSSLLSNENRSADTGRLEAVIHKAADSGIPVTAYFICGLEGDSVESTLDNLLYLHSLPVLSGISMFYPVPGLPGFPPDFLSSRPPQLCAGSSAYPWTNSLSTEQLLTAFRLSRLSNLLKTVDNLIPAASGRSTAGKKAAALVSRTINTRKLHTLSAGDIIVVPRQDANLVSGFLSALSLD